MDFKIAEGVRRFLIKAHKAGYAAGDAANKRKEEDSSETIVYHDGDWDFKDNYFGGEPYGGREVVSYKGKVVWVMVYYGSVVEGYDPKLIHPFLQKALQEAPNIAPYRGPENYHGEDISAKEWRALAKASHIHRRWPWKSGLKMNLWYENEWKGLPDSFYGRESISVSTLWGSIEIYSARYMGGLVNQL
jgi:hypothetical protein